MAARLVVQLWDGEVLVHEYVRSTTLHREGGIGRLVENAMGWLQAYGAQVTNEQWHVDAKRAQHGQEVRR